MRNFSKYVIFELCEELWVICPQFILEIDLFKHVTSILL